SGIYYFKFKSEEGMKKVLESGPCGIGKIMSGVGKPLLMDNMTRERCLKKASKMDFARVLVETFGHTTLTCKVRSRTEEEIAAKTLRDVLKVRNFDLNVKGKSVADDDGFTMVGRKNKHVASQKNMGQAKSSGHNKVKKKAIVDKPILASTFNHNFRPKVLVRGSGSAKVMESSLNEDILVKNSFNILNSDNVDGEDLGDDEGDFKSDDEGITVDMKPEVDVNVADSMEINAAPINDVS
nr:hypothetical protein [Tanacetum cinerariifolium]